MTLCRCGGPVRAWKVPDKLAVDAFFAMHTAIPELRDAEAIFANPYFIKMGYTSNLDRRLKAKGGKGMGFAETLIATMNRDLRWCGNTIDLNRMAHATMIGHDCYGKGTKAPM